MFRNCTTVDSRENKYNVQKGSIVHMGQKETVYLRNSYDTESQPSCQNLGLCPTFPPSSFSQGTSFMLLYGRVLFLSVLLALKRPDQWWHKSWIGEILRENRRRGIRGSQYRQLFGHKSQSLSRVQLLQPHGLQPARLLCQWDSPGKKASGLPFPSSYKSFQRSNLVIKRGKSGQGVVFACLSSKCLKQFIH